jgi:hypothetical protein
MLPNLAKFMMHLPNDGAKDHKGLGGGGVTISSLTLRPNIVHFRDHHLNKVARAIQNFPTHGGSIWFLVPKVIKNGFINRKLASNVFKYVRLDPGHNAIVIAKPVLVGIVTLQQEPVVFGANSDIIAKDLRKYGAEAGVQGECKIQDPSLLGRDPRGCHEWSQNPCQCCAGGLTHQITQ